MQRYIVSEQILGVMLSKFFLDNNSEIRVSDLNFTIRSISYQIQEQCEVIVNFSRKDIYHFINSNGKYFSLDEDRIVLSEYTENRMHYDFPAIQDLFDTKFIAGLPNDIISVVDQNLVEI